MTTPHVLFNYVRTIYQNAHMGEDESALYWTDITEQEIHRLPSGGGVYGACWRFRKKVGCFA
ncbi:hypothetical protein KCP69_09395 [Salmonella enterica subsp. enterica]|nr:hypothetical protein KCP69_09395 [Salmonella enterica subsp. enterica]